MNIDTSGSGLWIVILVMAGVTLATRWGGLYVMSYVPVNRAMQRFIKAMSGSVLVALLAPLAFEGDTGARLALLTTAMVVIILKKPMLAIAAGILVAAICRQF